MTAPQPHLNGAYYGPPIPPPPQQAPSRKFYSHGRQRGGSSSSCNPFTWCFCCLCDCVCSLILQILITILVVIAVAVFLFWLIFHPNVPKFHVTGASLTQFDFNNNNNTLRYDLAVKMTFRNPNRRIGIYYDSIEATAFYHGQRFAMSEIPRFYLGHKKENNVSAEFSGQQVVVGDLSEYNSERNDGVYKIDLKLKLRIRFKVWWAKTGKFTPKIECDLKVPLHSNGTASAGSFQRTKCGFDW